MATTTRAVLRERISDAAGDWYGTLTADSGSSTTIVDTELNDLVFGGDDDGILNWYVIVTDGNNIGEVRRISAYVASTNTITVSRAFTNAIVTHTYEVHRHNPTDYHAAMNRAMDELFPFIYLPIRDQSIIIDNLLANPLFDIFDSGFTNWTEVGSPTVTQETTISIQGSSSAKVISGGSDGQLTQAPTVNIATMEGKTVTFKCWVYTTTATTARLRLDWDGSTFENGDYHTGADQWELITVSGDVPEGATQVKAICEVESGTLTAYFDFCSLVIDPVYEYTLPANLLNGPYQVYQQDNEQEPNGTFSALLGTPVSGRMLRLIGKGLYTTQTSETTTIETSAPRTELIIAQAAFFLNRQLSQRAASQQRQRYLDDMKIWSDEVTRMKRVPGVRSPFIGAQYESGLLVTPWHTEENSTGRILILNQIRGSIEGLGFTTLL